MRAMCLPATSAASSGSMTARVTIGIVRWAARSGMVAAVALLAAVLGVLATPAAASAVITQRVSIDSAGIQGNGTSLDASLSADGRFVAFASGATNLVPGDTNGAWDVFVHDRL